MKTNLWILILVISSLLLTFCRKENTNNSVDNSTIGYFPNGVGSFWEYARFDSITNHSDTIFVRVKSTVLKNGKNYSLWTYEKSSMVLDSALVYASQDSVIMLGPDNFYSPKIILLPYTLHNKWNSSEIQGDTSYVEAQYLLESLQTFKIIRRFFGVDLSWNYDEWLAPHVGLIKENIKEFNLLRPKNESWMLIDYLVK